VEQTGHASCLLLLLLMFAAAVAAYAHGNALLLLLLLCLMQKVCCCCQGCQSPKGREKPAPGPCQPHHCCCQLLQSAAAAGAHWRNPLLLLPLPVLVLLPVALPHWNVEKAELAELPGL
jgi:hypothetical protein